MLSTRREGCSVRARCRNTTNWADKDQDNLDNLEDIDWEKIYGFKAD